MRGHVRCSRLHLGRVDDSIRDQGMLGCRWGTWGPQERRNDTLRRPAGLRGSAVELLHSQLFLLLVSDLGRVRDLTDDILDLRHLLFLARAR